MPMKYAVFHKTDGYYVPLPCNKWVCTCGMGCGAKNKKNLELRISQSEVLTWSVVSHVTLTLGGYDDVACFDEDINHFMTDLRRGGTFTFDTVHGKRKTVTLPARPNLRYFKMKEFQIERHAKTGLWYLHAHFIFNQHITKYDVIPIWNNCTHSDFNTAEDTHPHNVSSGYLTKYLTKTELQDLFQKGERRYSASRGVLPAVPVRVPSGHWVFMSIESARQVLEYIMLCDPCSLDKYAKPKEVLNRDRKKALRKYNSLSETARSFIDVYV